ncbi:hypothetical protein ACHHYP_01212 [Achlya hypogyna]|uniref:Uncharacterized protein n=1 Tax=Achlya hypogyna TaxID=1202772 RepID=A0A1V9Z901_ACHHY|nr:hypothetical protein ACHHYP_01212 [Achlya hypogyna]
MTAVQDGVVAALEERVAELGAEALEREQLIVHLEAEKREIRRLAERMQSQLRRLQATGQPEPDSPPPETRYLSVQRHVQDLEAKCASQQSEITALRQALEAKDEAIDEYIAQIDALEDQVAELKMLLESDPEPMHHDWIEETTRYPTPHFDLNSTEVIYVLSQWTQNPTKAQALRAWLVQVADEAEFPLAHDHMPLAIELPRLSPEVRDGFLTLIVPLLRKQLARAIHVHTRVHDADHTDLRIRVVPRLH